MPVEPFDDENSALADGRDLCRCDRQAERLHQRHAIVLVVDAVRHVDHPVGAGYLSKFRLQDVSCRGHTGRSVPFSIDAKQGRLFLRTRDRDPEFLLPIDAKWSLRKIGEERLDLGLADRFAFDVGSLRLICSFGQEPHGTDAIASDGFEQTIEVGALGTHARRHAAACCIPVREKIVEHGDDRRAAIGRRGQRQRERYREAMLPSKPLFGISETGCTACCPFETADQPAVDKYIEGRMGLLARHSEDVLDRYAAVLTRHDLEIEADEDEGTSEEVAASNDGDSKPKRKRRRRRRRSSRSSAEGGEAGNGNEADAVSAEDAGDDVDSDDAEAAAEVAEEAPVAEADAASEEAAAEEKPAKSRSKSGRSRSRSRSVSSHSSNAGALTARPANRSPQ